MVHYLVRCSSQNLSKHLPKYILIVYFVLRISMVFLSLCIHYYHTRLLKANITSVPIVVLPVKQSRICFGILWNYIFKICTFGTTKGVRKNEDKIIVYRYLLSIFKKKKGLYCPEVFQSTV